jgi:hypothetical protein
MHWKFSARKRKEAKKAGDDTAVMPGLVVVTPPKKRRVRPSDSARKRREAKKAGDDTAVTPGLVVGTPPKKRRVRPADSARKRKEEKNAKEMIADQADVWDITKTPARSNIDNKGKRGSQNGWKNGGVNGSRDHSPPPSLVGGGGVRIGAPYPTIISTAGGATTNLLPHDHQGHMKPPPPMTTMSHCPPPKDAIIANHDGGFPDPNFLQALASRRWVAFFMSFSLSQYIIPTYT